MKLPSFDRKRVSAVLLVIAALMLIDVVYQVGMHIRWRRWTAAAMATVSPAPAAASQPAGGEAAASQASSSQPSASQSGASQTAGSPPAATQAGASQASQPAGTQPVTTKAAASQAAGPKTPPALASGQASRPGPGGPQGKPGGSAAKPPKPYVASAAVKRRNIFAEPKPKGHGLTLTGVLGTTALFSTREGQPAAIEEGQSGAGGVKVTGIDGTVVKIEFEGKPETLTLSGGGPASSSSPSMPPPRGGPGMPVSRAGRPDMPPGNGADAARTAAMEAARAEAMARARAAASQAR